MQASAADPVDQGFRIPTRIPRASQASHRQRSRRCGVDIGYRKTPSGWGKEDHLDLRLEVAELLQSPTSALAQIWIKWQWHSLYPGQSGCFSLSTFGSLVKCCLGLRPFPAQTLSSRYSKRCSPCAPFVPTAAAARTASTWATSPGLALFTFAEEGCLCRSQPVCCLP
jgi:hypothetical protein